MNYGSVVAPIHPPDLTEIVFQSVWYECLSALRVDRCLHKKWHMLPSRVQDLELSNINIDILCSNMYCIKNNWGEECATENLLKQQAYDEFRFQIEVDLSGSIFN